MRFAFADPPYPGQSFKHYRDHPDYAGEVDHFKLAEQLCGFDGWVLHTSSPALFDVQLALRAAEEDDYRVMAWVKPFCAFKRNVPVAYAWEPVLVKALRKPEVTGRVVMRDFVEEVDPELDELLEALVVPAVKESITMKRGLTGVKPEAVCRWAFEVAGAQPTDEFHDLFPGSGAVAAAWERWSSELRLEGVA